MFIKVVRAPSMFDAWVVISPEGTHLVRACEEVGLFDGEAAAWFLAEPSGEGWRIVQRLPGERRPCGAPRSGAMRRALAV